MTVNDAHTSVLNALAWLDGTAEDSDGLQIADLNESERPHAIRALSELSELDEALAVRSEFEEHQLGCDTLGDGE